jgi:predicted HicB family RNase H-like nuclease
VADPKVQQFVGAAPRKAVQPWNVPGVRDDLRKELNVRVSERVMIKMKSMAVEKGIPLRDLVEQFLEEGWSREAKHLGWTDAG